MGSWIESEKHFFPDSQVLVDKRIGLNNFYS